MGIDFREGIYHQGAGGNLKGHELRMQIKLM